MCNLLCISACTVIFQCKCRTSSSLALRIIRRGEHKQVLISLSPIIQSLQKARTWCYFVGMLCLPASSVTQREDGFWRLFNLSIWMMCGTSLLSGSTKRPMSLSSKMFSRHLKCPHCDSYLTHSVSWNLSLFFLANKLLMESKIIKEMIFVFLQLSMFSWHLCRGWKWSEVLRFVTLFEGDI